MVDNLVAFPPFSEVAALAIISIVRHRHFRADKDDFAIQDENSAVVPTC